MLEQILAASIVLTTPILLAAMGGLVNRQSGIVNIGLEAEILAGAMVAVIVSSATGSWLLACIAALLAGTVIGWLFALTITRGGANMIVAGLGLNVLVAGGIGFILSWVYGTSGTLRLPEVALLPHVLPGGVEGIPVVGRMLAALDPLTLLAWATVAVLPILLADTVFGLRLRATGNAPQVAGALGLNGLRIQEQTTAIAGALSGLAGAHLALASIGLFNEGLSGGRGFIALAAFYFGRDRPWPTAFVCLMFGFLDATQIRLQTAGLPPKLIGMIPYLMVLAALIFASIRNKKRSEAS